MRLQWTQDLDIETLDARGHWATIEELLEVVRFRSGHEKWRPVQQTGRHHE